MKYIKIVIMILIVLMVSGGLDAKMYFWVDENGVKRFSNEPPPEDDEAINVKVTEEIEHDVAADEARRRMERGEPGGKADSEQTGQDAEVAGDWTQSADVVMYSRPGCGACRMAQKFFKKHNVRYTEYDISVSKSARDEFKKLNGRGVPLILIGDRRITGYNTAVMKSALGMTGK